jgi:hypothetical protein
MDDFDELPKMAGWHEAKLAQPMEIVVPTNKLRFVERDSYSKNGEHFTHPHKVRILQQWWASTTKYGSGQWRDIPIEQESA